MIFHHLQYLFISFLGVPNLFRDHGWKRKIPVGTFLGFCNPFFSTSEGQIRLCFSNFLLLLHFLWKAFLKMYLKVGLQVKFKIHLLTTIKPIIIIGRF